MNERQKSLKLQEAIAKWAENNPLPASATNSEVPQITTNQGVASPSISAIQKAMPHPTAKSGGVDMMPTTSAQANGMAGTAEPISIKMEQAYPSPSSEDILKAYKSRQSIPMPTATREPQSGPIRNYMNKRK